MYSNSLIKKFDKFFFLILLFATFLAPITSCSYKSASFSDAEKWIPMDFNPSSSVLLVEEHRASNKENSKMLEWLQKNYPYPYEVVDTTLINSTNGKYADTKKYRFAEVENTRQDLCISI